MKPAIHAYLCDDTGHRFFGNGPMRLLQLIGETGSLRCAAQQMGLSYSKALVIVKRAEAELGFALTEKTIGGRGGGLGSAAGRQPQRQQAERQHCGAVHGVTSFYTYTQAVKAFPENVLLR